MMNHPLTLDVGKNASFWRKVSFVSDAVFVGIYQWLRNKEPKEIRFFFWCLDELLAGLYSLQIK